MSISRSGGTEKCAHACTVQRCENNNTISTGRGHFLKAIASLTQTTNSKSSRYARVTLKARQLLIQQHVPNDSQRQAHFEFYDKAPLPEGVCVGEMLFSRTEILMPLIEQETPILPLALHLLNKNLGGSDDILDTKKRLL